ncbi:PQQ-binding-like beta-propeller repeat protein [Chitinophaga qingshengii]|uniref:PQQ-binding-like beta-propeller repeat protein n=1 Tax=Chitinophaga qingshengii TaxID=1569794 RepID=A0ABR7TJA2_9BACT|nr:PQQ-binding-like beta-propeller repeat protein [Chitinophaga qingshengii]MBC9930563.1 PQQ-binding-like beta-propeller repeat protein [Chitinophaga qingshengii]
MHKILFFVATFILALAACKKIAEKINFPPDQFSVVVARKATTAKLTWNGATDPDGDTLTFAVELEGQSLVNGLTVTQYEITGLLPYQGYKGKVIATDPKGLKRIVDFEIIPYGEQLLVYEMISHLASFDLDGNRAWEHNWDCRGAPVVFGDTLIVSMGSSIIAARASDGEMLWIKKDMPTGRIRYPMLHNGIVYVEAAAKLHALNVVDGSTIWSMNCDSRRDLAIGNETLYLLDVDANDKAKVHLKAIHLKTGMLKWSVSLSSSAVSALVAKNGMLYFTQAASWDKPDYLLAFDANTGIEKWRYELPGSSLFVEESGAPVILGDIIYIPVLQTSSLVNKTLLYAFHANDGKLVWKQYLENIYTGVDELAADATGIYACGNNQLIKVNPANGSVIWSQSGDFSGSITLTEENVFTTSGGIRGTVMAFNVATGQSKRVVNGSANYFYSPVAYKNEKVFYPARSPMSTKN